ncbi:putative ABC transporter ATP-binding protein [Levilactobacillus zymae]|uniref:ABC transporter ATP-binding protein n=2 Tax=Levilactobacillus zymae TaxID=267363 RepID=A0ABQ0WZH8_9LACO|nr:ATP-binding cassette domain-containing protein [Levilactobacillus zymae]GEO71872.1 putative ABC transporter ATP-binding protein [Levilactobacillus zymae]
MGELIRMENFSFTYPQQKKMALQQVDLRIATGDFITLVGATGSGKTTLLKQFKRELVPAGEAHGTVTFQGEAIQDLALTTSAQKIGFVAQNPLTQPIMATVLEELTFPLENLGYSTTQINSRIAELANFLGLDQLLPRAIKTLSGGQIQLVNLASVLALEPDVILLDEPTAQLDPTTAQNFLNVLRQVHDELGITIVLTEHRLSRVLALANRLVVLQSGSIIYDGNVSAGLEKMTALPELADFVPPIPQFFLQHHLETRPLPLTVPTGRQLLAQRRYRFEQRPNLGAKDALVARDDSLLTVKKLLVHFDDQIVLRRLELTVPRGDWLAIIGKNGSGKSTLLSVLAGLLKPEHGKVWLAKQLVWKMKNLERLRTVAYLAQNPTDQFSGKTVIEELRDQARLADPPVTEQQVTQWLATLRLTAVAHQNVFDLSGGQQQLVGLGLALMTRPQLLLLDEPTKGLDPTTKRQLGTILQRVHAAGTTIVMASHDMAFCAQYAQRCTFMFAGQLNQPVTSRQFFTQNFLFTTAINRLLRDQVPTALFSTDVRQTLKGGE